MSGRDNVLKQKGQIVEIGQNAETYSYYEEEQNIFHQEGRNVPNESYYVSSDVIVAKCKESIQLRNYCVITIHPQEYSSKIVNVPDLSPERFEVYKKLLNDLQAMNIPFKTFREVVKCEENK